MNDLIKRQDAIKVVKELLIEEERRHLNDSEYGFNQGVCHAVDLLEDLPSADKPKGKWIRKGYWSKGIGMGESYGFYYECSNCGEQAQGGYYECGVNYCPYCGADMRKGADDE